MADLPPVMLIGELVLSRCKARKATECWRCGAPIPVGETIYRPLTNGGKRMQRFHARCVVLGHKEPAQ